MVVCLLVCCRLLGLNEHGVHLTHLVLHLLHGLRFKSTDRPYVFDLLLCLLVHVGNLVRQPLGNLFVVRLGVGELLSQQGVLGFNGGGKTAAGS